MAQFLGRSPIVVGRDMRESGVALREALLEGILGEGADVIDVGRVMLALVTLGVLLTPIFRSMQGT